MRLLAEETGTLVVLAVRDGDKLVLIRTWRPTRVASIWLEVGQRVPLQPFSSWRAFIAAARPAEIERIAAERLPLTSRTLLVQGLKMPWMTLKVVAGIHWEALKLWLRGARYHPKPSPPNHESS